MGSKGSMVATRRGACASGRQISFADADTRNSKSGRRKSDNSSSIVSAKDVTYSIASTTFLHSVNAKCAIPSGLIVTGFGLTEIKVFRAVSARFFNIIS